MAITICHKCETRFDLDVDTECPSCLSPLPEVEIITRPSPPSKVTWDDPLDD